MKSLFMPFKAERLTSLKIQHDWKTGTVHFWAAREWDESQDWSRYNKDFYMQSIMANDAIYLNSQQVRDLYTKYDLLEYLDDIVDLLRQGKHFGMECYYFDKYNIRFMCHQHSRVLGINNKSHATLTGGIRRHPLEDVERDVIIDGLNLGRAMSYKNIAANLSFGGCKTTVHMNELDMTNMQVMGFLAFALDRVRCCTGPDMYFPTEMADEMNKYFTVQYTNGPKSPTGASGKPTAYGVYHTMKQALKFLYGSDSVKGKSVALMGLGQVGWYMAEHLLSEDIKLIVSDINPERLQALKDAYPNKNISVVDSAAILFVDADIFCPCAIGGIFDESNIYKLKFKMIWGAANNQLRASSVEEEIRLAKMLDERGILFQSEWWHNAAGVMCGAEDYNYGPAATYEHLIQEIDKTVPLNTWKSLNEAKKMNITPTEYVYGYCNDILFGKA